MRILFLAHRIPYPPDKGDKIRAFHEIRGLAAQGHQVDVLAFADDRADLKRVDDLRQHCASAEIIWLDTRIARGRSLMALFGSRALSLAYFEHHSMGLAVAERLRDSVPDACVVYSSPMAQYVPATLRRRTVVDLVDVDSEKWRDYSMRHRWPISSVYATEARRLRNCELSIVEAFGRTVLSTEREASLLQSRLSSSARERLSAIVNGVDLDFYGPAGQGDRRALPQDEREFLEGDRPRVAFVGAMDYYANEDAARWFAAEVWPVVRAGHPTAQFLIVGAKPTSRVRALERFPGVTVTGRVEDVRPYLWSADVCVVPLRIARGVQNKVLEAFACARPLAATGVALAGLSVRVGVDALVADDAPGLAAAVHRLLVDPSVAARLGRSARSYAERAHSWQVMLERFVTLVESVAAPGGDKDVRTRRDLAAGRTAHGRGVDGRALRQ